MLLNIFLYFDRTALGYNNAGLIDINFDVEGLDPGVDPMDLKLQHQR
jgi:hypothetical protein